MWTTEPFQEQLNVSGVHGESPCQNAQCTELTSFSGLNRYWSHNFEMEPLCAPPPPPCGAQGDPSPRPAAATPMHKERSSPLYAALCMHPSGRGEGTEQCGTEGSGETRPAPPLRTAALQCRAGGLLSTMHAAGVYSLYHGSKKQTPVSGHVGLRFMC